MFFCATLGALQSFRGSVSAVIYTILHLSSPNDTKLRQNFCLALWLSLCPPCRAEVRRRRVSPLREEVSVSSIDVRTNPGHSESFRANPNQNFFRHSPCLRPPLGRATSLRARRSPGSSLRVSKSFSIAASNHLKPDQPKSRKAGESFPAPIKVEIGRDSSRSPRTKVEIAQDSSTRTHHSA